MSSDEIALWRVPPQTAISWGVGAFVKGSRWLLLKNLENVTKEKDRVRLAEPLKAFARKLKAYLPRILSHCRFPLHTSVLEGINNKIKVIKRMA